MRSSFWSWLSFYLYCCNFVLVWCAKNKAQPTLPSPGSNHVATNENLTETPTVTQVNKTWQHSQEATQFSRYLPTIRGTTAFPNFTDSDDMDKAWLFSTLLNHIQTRSDSRLRPNIGGPPVEVLTDMYVIDIGDISEANMEFRVSFFFRQYWKDPRLAYAHTGYNKRLALNAKMVHHMWIPDIYFVNEKIGVKHDLTKENEVIRLWPDGRVFYSMRLSMTASCSMTLLHYPMDKQICKLIFESFSYEAEELMFRWNENGKQVIVPDQLEIPQFILTHHSTSHEYANFTSGSYSRLTVMFNFERSIGFFLIQTYVPAYLIVMLSWISFWIKHSAVPARIALGITTVLTMTTLTNSARASLPRVSYVKSIEWFLIVCFLYVFASLIEFACVSYEFHVKIKKGFCINIPADSPDAILLGKDPEEKQEIASMMDKSEHSRARSRKSPLLPFTNSPLNGFTKSIVRLQKQRSFTNKEIEGMDSVVDSVSRVLFPTSFVLINIIYWLASWYTSD